MAKHGLEQVLYLPPEAHDGRHERHGQRELISMSAESFGELFVLLCHHLSNVLK